MIKSVHLIFRNLLKIQDSKILTARKLAGFSIWLWFVFVYAFYSSALIMFAATPQGLPFTTLEVKHSKQLNHSLLTNISMMFKAGLNAYPEWKYIVENGYEIFLNEKASLGLEPHKSYWEMVQANPDEFRAESTAEALEKLKLPGYFMYTTESTFFYTQTPESLRKKNIDVRFVRDPNALHEAMPLSKDSPYSRVFDLGISMLQVKSKI